jgi:hypothetical protein
MASRRQPVDHEANIEAAKAKLTGKTRKKRKPAAVICGYPRANGEFCQRPAGWGTLHVGVGGCKSHDKRDEKWQAIGTARPSLELLVGHQVDVSPLDALLMCVRITAAEVTYFSARIAELEANEVMVRPKAETVAGKDPMVFDVRGKRELNMWIQARKESMRDLSRFSKMALDAGVEERMVRVAERIGDQLAAAVRGILDDLQLTAEQAEQAPQIVRRHLKLLEGGRAA